MRALSILLVVTFGAAGLVPAMPCRGAAAPAACCSKVGSGASGAKIARACCCRTPIEDAHRRPLDLAAASREPERQALVATLALGAPVVVAPATSFAPPARRAARPPPTLLAARTALLC
jgi:hypothetical protein